MASKSAISLSIIVTTKSTGSPRETASWNMRSVPTSTPEVAVTTQRAPSAAASPAIASPWKSRNPGVSMRLIFVSAHSANAQPRLMEYPRSISSGAESVRVVPSPREPWRLLDPDTKASASTKLVLPLAPCPTTAMLRISDPRYSRISDLRFQRKQLGEGADAWGRGEPGAKRFVGCLSEGGRVHGQGAHRLAPVADTAK